MRAILKAGKVAKPTLLKQNFGKNLFKQKLLWWQNLFLFSTMTTSHLTVGSRFRNHRPIFYSKTVPHLQLGWNASLFHIIFTLFQLPPPLPPSPTHHKVRFEYWRNSISISYVRRKITWRENRRMTPLVNRKIQNHIDWESGKCLSFCGFWGGWLDFHAVVNEAKRALLLL